MTTEQLSKTHSDLRNEYLLSLWEFRRDHSERNRKSLNKAGAELQRRGQNYLSTVAGTIQVSSTH
jgi:hypothetical protein